MIDRFTGEYAFLSNFYVDGHQPGSTVEHRFQAAKTEDPVAKDRVLSAPTPGASKGLGRRVSLVDGWDDKRIEVMRSLLRDKFSTDPLKGKLLNTGNEYLVEGNTWGDRFWGVDSRTGAGQNWLGRLLMDVREEISE